MDEEKRANISIDKTGSDYRNGVICVLACQLIWGFLPMYWQALTPISSWVIILYRMTTMFVYTYIAARLRYSREEIMAPLRKKGAIGRYLTAGMLLTANWSVYIWAMTTGHMVQSSIGYYIEPLVICLMGIIIFKEKLTGYNLAAMIIAAVALTVMLIHYRQLPGVALILAFTWAGYSAIKKTSNDPPVIDMVHESLFYALVSVITILVIELRGAGALSLGMPGKYALLFLSGLVTLIPIALFGWATKRVTLLVIGIAQYISPSITLLLGIFVYKESIDRVQLISFAVIWIGLVIFTYGEFKENRGQL